MKLSPIQEKIVETPGNLIVRASAGTGKTHTMVNKIAKEIDDNHTHKVIAAITFIIKAAQEIKDRLSVDVVQHFIGTNNSFVIEEVIKPFMKDVYGADFDLDMSTDYSAKVDTFQEAIEKIRNEGILCSYRDNKRNFIFDLAQEIVENSSACRLYLQAKYFKIYIDEYQDCDKSKPLLWEMKNNRFIYGGVLIQRLLKASGTNPILKRYLWEIIFALVNKYRIILIYYVMRQEVFTILRKI